MAYSQDEIKSIFNIICDRIIEGESVKTILKDKDMPSSKTFWKWLDQDKVKVNQYARAKEIYADKVFEDIVLIADGTNEDVFVDEDGIEQTNHNIIQRDRLRIDARKWHLSKLNPKKYGDKIDMTSGGEKMQQPILNIDPLSSNE
jgi:hypothetical protein